MTARRSRSCPQRHQALVADLGRELGYVMPSLMDYIPASDSLGLYSRLYAEGVLIAVNGSPVCRRRWTRLGTVDDRDPPGEVVHSIDVR